MCNLCYDELGSWNPDDLGKRESVMSKFSFAPNEEDRAEEVHPNGYTRGEYYKQGYSDFDIEFWNLNQTGAPSPHAAGWVLTDLMEDDFDGDIEF